MKKTSDIKELKRQESALMRRFRNLYNHHRADFNMLRGDGAGLVFYTRETYHRLLVTRQQLMNMIPERVPVLTRIKTALNTIANSIEASLLGLASADGRRGRFND